MAELVPGVPVAISPLVRRIVAPNPGMMTGPGTNTYLVGIDEVAVIDPGPEDDGHLEAMLGCGGDRTGLWTQRCCFHRYIPVLITRPERSVPAYPRWLAMPRVLRPHGG